MKKVTSLLLLAGVAAFGLVGCGDDEAPPTDTGDDARIESVTVTPSDISIEPGQTAQVRVDFQTEGGVEGISVAWSSGNENVATVSPTGDQTAEVTGQSSGTVSITATVSASNANSQSASAGVTVEQIEDATLSIGEITNQAGNPVNVANVSGQINVEVNVEKADEDVDQVSLLVDGEVVSTQDFGSGNVEAQDVSAQSDVEVVVFNFRTDRLEGSEPGNVITAQNADLDGNTKRGQFDNSEHTISAQLTTGSGAVRSAENSQTLTFNNDNLAIAAHLSGGQGVVEPSVGNTYWGGEDIQMSITPVIFDGGVSAGSVTISASSGNQTASGSGAIVFDGNTQSGEPFVFTIPQAANAGGIEDARGAPDGPGGFGSDFGVADIRDDAGATVVGQFTLIQRNDFFLDFDSPDQGGDINVLLAAGHTVIPNDFLSDEPASAFTLPGTSDDGVGGTFTGPSDNFQIDVIDGSGATLFEDVDHTADLDENTLGPVENHATVSNLEDNLGNAAASIGIANSVDFAIDFNAPAESNVLPSDGGSSTFVFNGDASGGLTGANVLQLDVADPALSNGETPSGTDHASSTATAIASDGTETDISASLSTDRNADATAGDYAVDVSSGGAALAQGTWSVVVAFQDAANDPNAASQTFQFILDTQAPTFGALDPAPQSTGTDATSVFQDIGGTINDANEITSATINVRADWDPATGATGIGDHADGDGTDGTADGDGVCEPTDELLDNANGDLVGENTRDVTNGTNSIEFDERFEINDPFPSGSDTVMYCFFVNATDEALDNTGAADGNSASLNTESEIDWQ